MTSKVVLLATSRYTCQILQTCTHEDLEAEFGLLTASKSSRIDENNKAAQQHGVEALSLQEVDTHIPRKNMVRAASLLA